ncbi:unnamed protein product, partial [Didymodactylos carnosus]
MTFSLSTTNSLYDDCIMDDYQYCRRPFDFIINSPMNSCWKNAQKFTYSQLHSMNISSEQLLKWRIYSAYDYAIYLQTFNASLTVNNSQFVCNCSDNFVGRYCEYQYSTQLTFHEQLIKQESEREFLILNSKNDTYDNYEIDDFPLYLSTPSIPQNISTIDNRLKWRAALVCYIDINCTRGTPCLDWRQICDG